MIVFILILIWLFCGILAFRINCRMDEAYTYETDAFSGFFIIVILGVFSLILCIVCVVLNKIEDSKETEEPKHLYIIKKKLYELIVGKEPKHKNEEEE